MQIKVEGETPAKEEGVETNAEQVNNGEAGAATEENGNLEDKAADKKTEQENITPADMES